MNVQPRHVLCILGNWGSFSDVIDLLKGDFAEFTFDEEYSQLSPDDRMVTAFEVSQDRLTPTITETDWQAIEQHQAVGYVLSPFLTRGNSEQISGQALQLISELLLTGAVAAKSESAGLAHGRVHWIALARDYSEAKANGDLFSAGSQLYTAWVQRCLQSDDDTTIYSVGMHLLGHRDIEFAPATDLREAIRWIDLLGYYLLADRPDRPIKDGEGFRLAENGPRRIIKHVACSRYQNDDFFFNPYGYNRLVDASVSTKR